MFRERIFFRFANFIQNNDNGFSTTLDVSFPPIVKMEYFHLRVSFNGYGVDLICV